MVSKFKIGDRIVFTEDIPRISNKNVFKARKGGKGVIIKLPLFTYVIKNDKGFNMSIYDEKLIKLDIQWHREKRLKQLIG